MLTQEFRHLAISTPLGEDVLLLQKADIEEQLGKPFIINATLLATNEQVAFNDILGANVTLRYSLDDDNVRYFNGIVTEFKQLPNMDDYHQYQAIIRPWLWLLTLNENCRVFQELSVIEIIEKLFENVGFSDFEKQLSKSYEALDYVIQFNESDFNFFSRLVENHGIFYRFKHANGKHTLELIDDNSMLGELGDIPYIVPDASVNANEEVGINSWDRQLKVATGNIRLKDYDFEKPYKNLDTVTNEAKIESLSMFERYRYPGKFSERDKGTDLTKILMQQENVNHDTASAIGNHFQLGIGLFFTLTDHFRDDQNISYLITQTHIQLRSDEFTTNSASNEPLFTCRFASIPGTVVFRSPKTAIEPRMQGPQTAFVVGKNGEEIWTDKYGRIKIVFHWERNTKADESVSCWVRVAQTLSGKNWGTMSIPRIGQEVLVDFLNGDPDRPIVVGTIFNGSSMPTYELPEHQTRSGFKSRSSKGGDGFNEIRIEDKKDEEQIFIHAQKNKEERVKNDDISFIEHDKHTIVANDKFEEVIGNVHERVDADQFLETGGDKHEMIVSDFLQEVGANLNLTVTEDRKQSIDGDENLAVKGAIKVDTTQDYGLNASMNIDIKAGMSLNIEAGMSLSIKAGAGFITLGPDGVSIGGPMVKINSGGSAQSASPASPSSSASPQAPEEPLEADDDKSGEQSEILKSRTQTAKKYKAESHQVKSFSPAATSLQDGAKSGEPFSKTFFK